MIVMTLKDRTVYTLDDKGNVVARSNGPKGWDYSGEWTILGFLRRWNSSHMVPLAAALDGADIGHGYVVDLDHGHRRVWMQPSGHRLSSVRKEVTA